MANTPGGSFIPKRSTGKVAPTRTGRRIYIFSYIAYVFFFGTLLSVIGIFFLSQQADRQLQNFIVQVDEAQRAFNRDQIESIRKLDNRIKIAEQILNWHSAPSKIFEELESVIVKTVQLNNFSFERLTGSDAIISFGGITGSFDVLLFQRDVMENSALLSSADIVNVNYGAPESVAIGSSNRNGGISSPVQFGEATVTFVFENSSDADKLGYTPRTSGFSQQPDTTEIESVESDTGEDVSNLTE